MRSVSVGVMDFLCIFLLVNCYGFFFMWVVWDGVGIYWLRKVIILKND